jgi:hypothetical protein
MNSKLFLIFALTILALSFTSAYDFCCTENSVTAFLTYTDYSEQNTLEVMQGDSVRLTSVADPHNGPLWYEKLEILNKKILFMKYESGSYNSNEDFYLFTDTYTLDTSTLEPGTYTLRFTASSSNDCCSDYDELTLIVKEQEIPDTQCPLIDITYPEAKTYNTMINTATVSITEENELDSCRYVLNGQTKTFSCVKGINSLTNLNTVEGSNTLRVYAKDNYNNECYDEVTFNIDLPEPDTQCPIVDIIYPIDSATYDELISTATFTVNEDVKLESCTYNLNGNSYTIPNCINGTNTLTGLNTIEGSNTLRVSATDNSSNTCSDSVTFNIEIPEIDDECPEVTMISPINGATYQEHLTEAEFMISEENELGSCTYTINGVTNSFNCQKGLNTIPISTKEGSNTLVISVYDNSNNVCPETVNFNVQIPEIDDQCPLVNILEPESKTYNHWINDSIFTVNEDVKLQSCKYVLNGVVHSIPNCINGTNYLSNLKPKEGTNTLKIYATDNSSNTCYDSVTFTIDIPEQDTECPEINILYPSQGQTYNELISTATYTLSDESEIESCYYIVNNGQASQRYSCDKGTNYLSNLDFIEGSNTLKIFSRDEHMNECSASVSFNIELEEPPEDYCPIVNITSPEDSATYTELISTSTFTINEDYQLNSCSYTLNGNTYSIPNCINGSNSISGLNTIEGLNTLRISATDNASQTCYDEINFIIDLEDNESEDDQCPLVNIQFPESTIYDYLVSTSTFTVNEDVNLESCVYNLNGNTYTIPNCVNGSNSLTNLITKEGSNTLTIYATDNSSNTCSDSVTFTIGLEDEDEDENKTECCVEPDYYDYFYSFEKGIKDYYWNGSEDQDKKIELNLEFNPKSCWEKFIGWISRFLGIN